MERVASSGIFTLPPRSTTPLSLVQERALGVTPIEMMDREKAFIPELQLGFLDGIAGPIYKQVTHPHTP